MEKLQHLFGKSSRKSWKQVHLMEQHDIHSSKEAKRWQKRFCGPTMATFFNFTTAVAIIMTNKLVMGRVGFKFPVVLSLIHFITSWFLMAILRALSLLPPSPPSTLPFSSLLALGACISLSTALANVSLKYNSIGFYQMAKIAITPTTVLAEFIVLNKKVSIVKAVTLIVVSIGVAVATVTDIEFSFFGACIALGWIIPSALNKIMWSNLQKNGNWTALALMWRSTPITILCFMVLAPLVDPEGLFLFSWNMSNILAIIISSLLGFLLQWSGALALGATSPTSHAVLGQFKTCVILLGGYLFFDSNPGSSSISGATIALTAMFMYTYLSLRDSKESASNNQLLPEYNTLLSKHKTDSDLKKSVVSL